MGNVALVIAAMKEQGLSEAEARQRIYAFNRHGLLVEGEPGLRASQIPLARSKADVAGWALSKPGPISLLDTVRNAGITVLVGVSAQAGAFTEEIVRAMTRHSPRPVIFPLSNPTSVAEATPEDLLRWTNGDALVGTGSPFAPVEVKDRKIRISQINNSFIFPGLALGILVGRASRVTDGMMMAAAKALASVSPTLQDPIARFCRPFPIPAVWPWWLPKQSAAGHFRRHFRSGPATLREQLQPAWEPVYHPYERIKPPC